MAFTDSPFIPVALSGAMSLKIRIVSYNEMYGTFPRDAFKVGEVEEEQVGVSEDVCVVFVVIVDCLSLTVVLMLAK